MKNFKNELTKTIQKIKKQGLYKSERVITSQQQTNISVSNQSNILNFCANNYLGLSNHPLLVEAAKEGIEKYGFGLSSVRFICGTQTIHTELEKIVSNFLNKDDAILYTSCFDANGGLYETLLDEEDAIISDQLNHASIIDGIRLCKAKRFRYANSNMEELERILKTTQSYKHRLITTDGVFSMDGYIAKLDEICFLAKKYNAIVHVDDSHATGFIGTKGQGSAEYHNVLDQIDIITSTFGKALGGASGGFTAASTEIIALLRQRSRPYLFSNSLAPCITYASIKAIQFLKESDNLRVRLHENTQYFREKIKLLGFTIKEGIHPIVPIMIGDAQLAQNLAEDLLSQNVYVIGFSYPVVPKNEARIRVQISAAHTKEQIDIALKALQISAEKHRII